MAVNVHLEELGPATAGKRFLLMPADLEGPALRRFGSSKPVKLLKAVESKAGARAPWRPAGGLCWGLAGGRSALGVMRACYVPAIDSASSCPIALSFHSQPLRPAPPGPMSRIHSTGHESRLKRESGRWSSGTAR